MPSWNIHTAHVEKLFADHTAKELGIADENAFLFGNYVPDIYLGFMVPEVSFHIDYCLTHCADVNNIPVPDADRFWDYNIYRRRLNSDSCLSLTLGAWAHLVTDCVYNGSFRTFLKTHEAPRGEELRTSKQADFHLFGQSLPISRTVKVDSALYEAGRTFLPYSILPQDIDRAADVASAIVRGGNAMPATEGYRLLDAEWLQGVFRACDNRLASWLLAWQSLETGGERVSAAQINDYLLMRS